MRLCVSLFLVLIPSVASAQPPATMPELVKFKQPGEPRSHAKLKLPKGHAVGPTIPGLLQGAIPQGLAFWAPYNWLFISCYFHHDEGVASKTPSVVVAIDAKTGKLERCLTLVESNGKPHTGHVGGLAISDKYLWVGSEQLYRASLEDILTAQRFAHLSLQKLFHAECDASYIAYHDGRVWVGEFVSIKTPEFKGTPAHY